MLVVHSTSSAVPPHSHQQHPNTHTHTHTHSHQQLFSFYSIILSISLFMANSNGMDAMDVALLWWPFSMCWLLAACLMMGRRGWRKVGENSWMNDRRKSPKGLIYNFGHIFINGSLGRYCSVELIISPKKGLLKMAHTLIYLITRNACCTVRLRVEPTQLIQWRWRSTCAAAAAIDSIDMST